MRENRGATELAFKDAFSGKVDLTLDSLKPGQVRSYSYTLEIDYEEKVVSNLIAEGFDSHLSPQDVIDRPAETSKRGIVVAWKPKGDLSSCGDTYLCSARLRTFLEQFSSLQYCEVLHETKCATTCLGSCFPARNSFCRI